jgi:hypothetical protein
MESVLEEFLVWLGQSAQAIWTLVPETVTQTVAQGADAFYKLNYIAVVEGQRILVEISLAEWIAAAGLVLIVLGIRKRLYFKGVFLYSMGVGGLVLGLVNIVNPIALPMILRL